MKIVLGYASWTNEYGLFGHFAKRNSTWAPLNLGLLAAVCEQAGHEAVILDAEAMGWTNDRLAIEIIARKPDIVGFSAYSPFFHLSCDVAKAVKKLNGDIPIIIGGPHVTIVGEKVLREHPEFDYGFMGEAEDSLPEFLNAFPAPKYLSQVKGIIYRANYGKEIVSTGARWVTPDMMKKSEIYGEHPLDRLPLPARHLLPMNKYRLGTPNGRDHFTSLQTARGCPWQCVPAGTDILLATGKQLSVESIKKGDKVVCANILTGKPSVGTITRVGSRVASDIYRLEFIGGTHLDITGDHPIWTEIGWRRVKRLTEGSEIFGLSDMRKSGAIRAPDENNLRFSGLRERTTSAWKIGRKESDEAIKSSVEGEPNDETALWPSIVGFHARKKSVGKGMGDEKNKLEISASTTKKSYREAVGQDFMQESSYIAYRRREILDRSLSIGEAQVSRFYTRQYFKSSGDIFWFKKTQDEKRRTQAGSRIGDNRLHGNGLEVAPSMGRMFAKRESSNTNIYSEKVPGRWFKIRKITFMGRGLVYTLAVEPNRNFFANNLLVHNCVFCASDAIKTTRYIMKSPKRVVEEMENVAEHYPFVKHIYIVDDVLTFWPEHIIEICDRMDAAGLKFTFESSTRANLVDDKLIKRLAKSGLIRLSFGLETVDPEMRVTMQKKVPIEFYPKANRICSDNGVEAMNSIMIGLPGDTREKTEKLFEWVSQQRDIKQANLAIAIPYPGTEFHEMAVTGAHGLKLLSEDFSEYLRYGNAVTNVGDMTAQDLIEQQNAGFVKIYSKPWRWGPVFKKHGIIGFVLQMYRVLKLWWRMLRNAAKPFRTHPGLP